MKRTILNSGLLAILVLSASMRNFYKKENPVHVTRDSSMIEFYVKDFPIEGAIHRSFNNDLKRNDTYTIKFRIDGYLPYQIDYTKQSDEWTSTDGLYFGKNIGLAINANTGEIYKLNLEQICSELTDKRKPHSVSNHVLVIITSQINSVWGKIGQIKTK